VVLDGRRDSEIGGAFLGCIEEDIGDGHHIRLRDMIGQVLYVDSANPACTDDAYVDLSGHA
jgi:hypothetical protein